MRRFLDIYVAAVGLSLVWPLLVLVAVLIRLDSPGSPVFRQQRIGLKGKPFTVYKFRTMRKDSPHITGVQHVQDFGSFVFTPAGSDSRRTRLGGFLRATSLDEVLQLLNVLRGEMSVIGPRPDVPEMVAQYRPHYHARHDVPPGLTGLAQIHGRSDLTYAQTMSYDLAYARHRSGALDLRILGATPLKVLRREGAR
jgi:lipopolysaccharide/colanic/teichoic acid biosynthesis glycosyltransferase